MTNQKALLEASSPVNVRKVARTIVAVPKDDRDLVIASVQRSYQEWIEASALGRGEGSRWVKAMMQDIHCVIAQIERAKRREAAFSMRSGFGAKRRVAGAA